MLVTGLLFLYALSILVYEGIVVYLSRESLTPSHCSGSQCVHIATCEGMQDATFHIYQAGLILGGLIFGLQGFMGALNGHGSQLLVFSTFLAVFVGMSLCIMGGEVFYAFVCNRYSYNVIYTSVLWWWPGLPFNEAVKEEIANMTSYPFRYVNEITKITLLLWYLGVALVKVVFWHFVMNNATALGSIMQVGTAGLGANFSVKTWRDQTILTNQIDGVVRQGAADALHSLEADVGMIKPAQEGYGAMENCPRSFATRVSNAERQKYRAEAYGLQV